ncbi:unnamed protein product [Protopolystoma xenopodis]|uniref:Uncharacterized protein n=1 Tax=Protopolystoma xenopodis TaxID=117903 RepID=A0A448XIP4_9PLAT|nr:unnamed protein product [Protopolystoma xenopodis]
MPTAMLAKRLGMYHVYGPTLEMMMHTMDSRETSGNVPRPRSDSGNNYAYNGLSRNVWECTTSTGIDP